MHYSPARPHRSSFFEVLITAALLLTGSTHAQSDVQTPEATVAIAGAVMSTLPSTPTGSAALAAVPNINCPSEVSQRVLQIYSKNRALFDLCISEGQYQVFPFNGTLPTRSQVDSMARSSSCNALFTGCVMASFPQCDIGGLALKSVAETLVKIAVDVKMGMLAPGPDGFFDLLVWRRDVNLALAAGLPHDQDSVLFGEYQRNLGIGLSESGVAVASDLTITIDGQQVTYEPLAAFTASSTATAAGSAFSEGDDSGSSWVSSESRSMEGERDIHSDAPSASTFDDGSNDSKSASSLSIAVLLLGVIAQATVAS